MKFSSLKILLLASLFAIFQTGCLRSGGGAKTDGAGDGMSGTGGMTPHASNGSGGTGGMPSEGTHENPDAGTGPGEGVAPETQNPEEQSPEAQNAEGQNSEQGPNPLLPIPDPNSARGGYNDGPGGIVDLNPQRGNLPGTDALPELGDEEGLVAVPQFNLAGSPAGAAPLAGPDRHLDFGTRGAAPNNSRHSPQGRPQTAPIGPEQGIFPSNPSLKPPADSPQLHSFASPQSADFSPLNSPAPKGVSGHGENSSVNAVSHDADHPAHQASPGSETTPRSRYVANANKDLNVASSANFSFGYTFDRQIDASTTSHAYCQATFVKKNADVCEFVTAAHCFWQDKRPPGRPRTYELPADGESVDFSSNQFGKTKAQIFIAPSYRKGEKPVFENHNGHWDWNIGGGHDQDVAIVRIAGSACETGARVSPPVPLCRIEKGAPGRVASLHQRTMFNATNFVRDPINKSIVVTMSGTGISQGDSGGGYFQMRGSQPCLAAVLRSKVDGSSGYVTRAAFSDETSVGWAAQFLNVPML